MWPYIDADVDLQLARENGLDTKVGISLIRG